MQFTYKINTPSAPTGKVSVMESSKERKYCNTNGFFLKPFYQLVFGIPVQN